MRKLALLAVLAAAIPARADEHPGLHFDLRLHIPAWAYAEILAGGADLFFLGYDLYLAGNEGHMSPAMAAAELLVAAPQAAVYFYQYGQDQEAGFLILGIVTSALALHGGLSLAIPGIERPVAVTPTFVAKGAPGLAISGRF